MKISAIKNKLSVAMIACFPLVISACGGGSSAAREPAPENYVPALQVFDLVDSYGEDTAQPGYLALVIGPNDGVFDVFWEVDSLEDYKVTLWVNDRDTLHNSIRVHTQYCGAGQQCDQSGNWICQYADDFYLSCDGWKTESYISPIIQRWPQRVYMLLEVCDLDSPYCEFDSYPVSLERPD